MSSICCNPPQWLWGSRYPLSPFYKRKNWRSRVTRIQMGWLQSPTPGCSPRERIPDTQGERSSVTVVAAPAWDELEGERKRRKNRGRGGVYKENRGFGGGGRGLFLNENINVLEPQMRLKCFSLLDSQWFPSDEIPAFFLFFPLLYITGIFLIKPSTCLTQSEERKPNDI